MTTSTISTRVAMNVDAYGSYARQSALADYLEVAALVGNHWTEAALGRAIEENDWARLPRRETLTIENADDDPGVWAGSVFSVLRERAQILKDLYPFELNASSIKARKFGDELLDSPYLALLAITVLHAWSITLPDDAPKPEDALENVVARVLENRGLKVSAMGANDRATRSFVKAVVEAGISLGLEPMPDPRPRQVHVKDAGVDTLAGLTWGDGRRGGQWLFIGQATVGESNTWIRKLNEPQPALWADYMQEPLHPQAFLAVPHHVLTEQLIHLATMRRGLILDRIRLTPHMGFTSAPERLMIGQLIAVTVE